MTRKERLTKRTCKIIERGGKILLKKDFDYSLGGFGPFVYLGQWTNIAAGPDNAHFNRRDRALEFFNLEWAFAICKLYNCKVVVRYPKQKKK